MVSTTSSGTFRPWWLGVKRLFFCPAGFPVQRKSSRRNIWAGSTQNATSTVRIRLEVLKSLFLVQVTPPNTAKCRQPAVCVCSVLSARLPTDFYLQLRACLEVLVHPSVFLQLNQLSFTRSKPSGVTNSAGGLSERLDTIMVQAATTGLPQQLKVRPVVA